MYNWPFLRSGLSSTPSNGKVFYNYGNYLRDQERRQEARTCYKEALRYQSYPWALASVITFFIFYCHAIKVKNNKHK